jgi:general secretion pathway protein H
MRRMRGFTLIEIVIVVLIIAITLALVSVNLQRGDENRVRDEVDRLVLRLHAAQDEAILQGQVLVVLFSNDGYRFLRVNNKGQLTPIETDDTLAPQKLPDGMTLSFEMDGATEGQEAILVLEPSGNVMPFTLTVRAGQAIWQAQGLANGRIQAQPVGAAHAG